jgi:metallo-beta-lactamase family protein
MSLKLAFHGGAGTVTGSKYLLTAGHDRVLIDCGMFQGVKELRLMNWRRPTFEPASVRHILLTHAHIDHTGYLPRLVREGFAGDIHCTPGTRDIARVLLLDAAKLQEEDAAYANRKGFSKHHPALPLFTAADARHAMRRMRKLEYGQWLQVSPRLRARWHNSGHILGSAFIELRAAVAGEERTIVFSGDLGRYDVPLHVDPAPMPPCDVLVVESTYGDRLHDPTPLIDQIRRPFRETIARGGTILIPAFAIARVQLLTLVLRELMDSGDLPEVPIHIDSPMAVEATEIYRRHLGDGDLDPSQTKESWDRMFPRQVHLHRSVAESQTINSLPGRRIIISPSGMMTGGRVLHHLRRLLPDEKNLVVLAGYQAAGTRGDSIQHGAPTLRIHGRDVLVRAQTLSLTGLSAHADANELMRWIRSGDRLPGRVFVTHGEPPAAEALAGRIRSELGLTVDVPSLDEESDLARGVEPTRLTPP